VGIDRHELEHRNYRPDRNSAEARTVTEEAEIDKSLPKSASKPGKTPAHANQNARLRKIG
jgi:hypothetical protein